MIKKSTLSKKQLAQITGCIQNNQPQQALEKINLILQQNSQNTEAWQWRGQILRDSGNLQQAIASFDNALKLEPNNHASLNNMAVCLFRAQQYDATIACYQHLLRHHPHDAIAHFNLGVLLQNRQDSHGAIEHFSHALRLKPDYIDAARQLCHSYSLLNSPDSTDRIITVLETLQPHVGYDSWLLDTLAQAYLQKQAWREALSNWQRILEREPDNASVLNYIGYTLSQLGDHQNAADVYQRLIKLNATDPLHYHNMAKSLSQLGFQDDALLYHSKAAALAPDNEVVLSNYANTLFMTGGLEQAEQLCKAMLQRNPSLPEATAILIGTWSSQKRYDEIDHLCEQFLSSPASELDERIAMLLATACLRLTRSDDVLSLCEQRLAYPFIDSDNKVKLLFSLGRAYDKRQDYDRAYAFFAEGNALKTTRQDYYELSIRDFQAILRFSKTDFEHIPMATRLSDLPVFIVGMPRSGTSLVEQILSTHASVYGAGELPVMVNMLSEFCARKASIKQFPECTSCLQQADIDSMTQHYLSVLAKHDPAGVYTRITDKMPDNFKVMMVIARLFPKARIIHCLRNPLDTCLSIFFQDFTATHHYAYDQQRLGSYYAYYEQVVAHLKSLIDIPVFEIHYEDLIHDQEHWSRQLIDFCGLDWDKSCLDFYQSDRFVRTASSEQVNQPIYTSSIERWRHYAAHIQPMIQALEETRTALVKEIEQ